MLTHSPARILLMSATITPKQNMPGSSRADPSLRMKDYKEALKFYVSLPAEVINRIIFLENSDTDLTPLKNAIPKKSFNRVEFMNVSSDSPPEKGKGYGEFKMFDEGLEQSSTLRKDDYLWKVTGRLKILNIVSLIQSAPKEYEVYCDLRNVPLVGESLGGNRWMELRTFSFKRDAYDKYFKGQYENDFVLEKKFFETMHNEVLEGNRQIMPRFKIQPIIDGYSGYSNASYRNLSYLGKEKLRTVTRKIMPGLWL